MNAAILFSVSLMFIGLELYFTRILNLKTWNHVVYVIIPFAILGYGVGANLCLIARPFLKRVQERALLYWSLLMAAFLSIASTICLIKLPVRLSYLDTLFLRFDSIPMLLLAYSVLMIPFVVIGFVVVYLFQSYPSQSSRLYFFDLLGAGTGAFAFFVLIGRLQVLHSIFLFALLLVLLASFLSPRRRLISSLSAVSILGALLFLPEPVRYVVDPAKGWEWVPGYFEKHQFEHSLSRWHPMGRTDVFRILDRRLVQDFFGKSGAIESTVTPGDMAYVSAGTFEINLIPPPEFAYVSTNFLAGTPIYKLSQRGIREHGSRLRLFSQPMEAPYVLLRDPRVVIIGTGGGRDIFMARTHGAREIVGAEINPATYAIMSPGGEFYEYSGGVYARDNVRVLNMDGRHLVKNLARNSFDLVLLNGADTYSGLSTGAYAYAESYLYTKNAIKDYLALLDDRGIINFNRWFFPDMPRENLRLFVNAVAALRELGAETPWDHVMVGDDRSWAITLIKRSPFTDEERGRVERYFGAHDTRLIYPVASDLKQQDGATEAFSAFAESAKQGREAAFIDQYPFDISIVTDDRPFFYKHYKFRNFNPFQIAESYDVGPVMFLTQLLILVQATVFVLLFILLPLTIFRRQGIQGLPPRLQGRFIVYFSCLGLGFMFIEIPVMQRFTLLLGSPIHSISVTLVALLVATGVGSLLLPWLRRRLGSSRQLVEVVTAALIVYLGSFIVLGANGFDRFMHHDFLVRSLVVMACVAPLGILLGMYFPFGLELVGSRYEGAVPWAWGINSGFSVLGGILSIVLAQVVGFSVILMLACGVYLVACRSGVRMLELPGVGADG